MAQRHFELTIHEASGRTARPSYIGDVDEDFLVDFFGLNNEDVISYEIKEVTNK